MNTFKRLQSGLVQVPVLLGLALMLVALPVVSNMVKQNQENRSQAASCGVEGSTAGCPSGYTCHNYSCVCTAASCGACVPNCNCAANTCSGQTCRNSCGTGDCAGIKSCTVVPTSAPECPTVGRWGGCSQGVQRCEGYRPNWPNCETNNDCSIGDSRSCSQPVNTPTTAPTSADCNNGCEANTCKGQTCYDKCGGARQGAKDCTAADACSATDKPTCIGNSVKVCINGFWTQKECLNGQACNAVTGMCEAYYPTDTPAPAPSTEADCKAKGMTWSCGTYDFVTSCVCVANPALSKCGEGATSCRALCLLDELEVSGSCTYSGLANLQYSGKCCATNLKLVDGTICSVLPGLADSCSNCKNGFHRKDLTTNICGALDANGSDVSKCENPATATCRNPFTGCGNYNEVRVSGSCSYTGALGVDEPGFCCNASELKLRCCKYDYGTGIYGTWSETLSCISNVSSGNYGEDVSGELCGPKPTPTLGALCSLGAASCNGKNAGQSCDAGGKDGICKDLGAGNMSSLTSCSCEEIKVSPTPIPSITEVPTIIPTQIPTCDSVGGTCQSEGSCESSGGSIVFGRCTSVGVCCKMPTTGRATPTPVWFKDCGSLNANQTRCVNGQIQFCNGLTGQIQVQYNCETNSCASPTTCTINPQATAFPTNVQPTLVPIPTGDQCWNSVWGGCSAPTAGFPSGVRSCMRRMMPKCSDNTCNCYSDQCAYGVAPQSCGNPYPTFMPTGTLIPTLSPATGTQPVPTRISTTITPAPTSKVTVTPNPSAPPAGPTNPPGGGGSCSRSIEVRVHKAIANDPLVTSLAVKVGEKTSIACLIPPAAVPVDQTRVVVMGANNARTELSGGLVDWTPTTAGVYTVFCEDLSCSNKPSSNSAIINVSGSGTASCKECPNDFKCYQSAKYMKLGWYVTGYVPEGFENVVVPDSYCDGITKPTWLGKGGGDANCDGSLNGADYSTWRSEYLDVSKGQQVSRSTWEADFNCDSYVNGYDYSLWRSRYLR